MRHHAKGTFDVKITPQENQTGEALFGRLLLAKAFRGDLEAVSRGEMLTAGTAIDGSAGYVAIERVSGTLHGRRGSFTLLHKGTMGQGTYQMAVTVLPDSGTDALAGITGTLTIIIEGKQHYYELEYELPQ